MQELDVQEAVGDIDLEGEGLGSVDFGFVAVEHHLLFDGDVEAALSGLVIEDLGKAQGHFVLS